MRDSSRLTESRLLSTLYTVKKISSFLPLGSTIPLLQSLGWMNPVYMYLYGRSIPMEPTNASYIVKYCNLLVRLGRLVSLSTSKPI